MKTFITTAVFLSMVTIGFAQVQVDGYTRRDGTYVQPHYRSAPNDTLSDNYSTRGNRNPFTGERGTVRDSGNLLGHDSTGKNLLK